MGRRMPIGVAGRHGRIVAWECEIGAVRSPLSGARIRRTCVPHLDARHPRPAVRARDLGALCAHCHALVRQSRQRAGSIHPDEGRYAEIAREMVATGDWVTPRLNGLKYFEKPPLQYWVTALAYEAFGVHEWTARLWPALAGFLAVLAIGYAGLALGGATLGAFAALALAGTLWHAGIAQIVSLDSGLSFFLSARLCRVRGRAAPGDRRRRAALMDG